MASGELTETLPISARGAAPEAHSARLPFTRPAAEGGTGGVPCFGIGDVPVALDTVRWRMGQAVRLTIVMKANFSLYPLLGTSTPATKPPRFHPADVYFRDQPTAHVSAASDRVPWKTSIDVTLLGHARAAFGRAVPDIGLTFTAQEGGTVYFQRRAKAIGKRETEDGPPEPFVTMPVVYERAYGGPATPTNPIGTGDDRDAPLPSIIDPANPWRPAAFGPIASAWPLRHRKLGALEPRDLEQPVMVLPPDFDVSYFQSAPAAQQVPRLGPKTTFVLEGFHAERPRVEIRLPQALPAGAVYGLSSDCPDAPSPVDFYLDTVHIDAQSWLLTLTYRACVAVPDEAAFERLTVAAGLDMDEQVPRPETRQDPNEAPGGPRESSRRAPQPPRGDLTETLDLPASSPGEARSLPFGRHNSPFVAPPSARALPPEPERLPLPAVPEPPPPPASPPQFAPAEAPAHSLETTLATPGAPPAPAAALPAPPAPAAVSPAPVAAPAPPAAAPARDPAKDPYGQATPWARGPDPGDAQAPTQVGPKPRPERKFSLKKGFGKR